MEEGGDLTLQEPAYREVIEPGGRRVTFGQQGEVEIAPSSSKAGDYVIVRAEMPVIAVLSNCPQHNNPSSGFRPTPDEVAVWSSASGSRPQAT